MSRLEATVVCVALAATAVARAETPIPAPPERWATDEAGVLSPAARNQLDARLGDYARLTGHQVVVYIGVTTGGVPIEDWAVKAFERWRVGRQGIDDGLVLFIFSADRQMRIEVGYGLEPVMTDAKASRIIRDVIAPRIRAGDRDAAVRAGVDAILSTLGGQGAPPAPAPSRFSREEKRTLWIVALGFLAIPVLLLLLAGVALLFPRGRWLRRTGGGQPIGSDQESSSDTQSGGSSSGSDGFSGGGGRSGGGGASGTW